MNDDGPKSWKWNGEPVTWREFCRRLTGGRDVNVGNVHRANDGTGHYEGCPKLEAESGARIPTTWFRCTCEERERRERES